VNGDVYLFRSLLQGCPIPGLYRFSESGNCIGGERDIIGLQYNLNGFGIVVLHTNFGNVFEGAGRPTKQKNR
jgi:hypothetical protein